MHQKYFITKNNVKPYETKLNKKKLNDNNEYKNIMKTSVICSTGQMCILGMNIFLLLIHYHLNYH